MSAKNLIEQLKVRIPNGADILDPTWPVSITLEQLREIIAALSVQPVQQGAEPVAWRYRYTPSHDWKYVEYTLQKAGMEEQPLYTAPPVHSAATDEVITDWHMQQEHVFHCGQYSDIQIVRAAWREAERRLAAPSAQTVSEGEDGNG